MYIPKLPLFFCVTLIILNVLDVITTYYGLRIGLSEANPLFKHHIVPVKLIAPVILMVLVQFTYIFYEKHSFLVGLTVNGFILILLNVLYTVIVISNVTHILLARCG